MRENAKGNVGPNLNPELLVSRLEARLNSEAYVQAMQGVDELDREPFVSFEAARHEVLEADGPDKVRLWIKNRLLEPKFDHPTAMMPNLGLSEKEAIVIADYLVEQGYEAAEAEGVIGKIKDLLPTRNRNVLFLAFITGLFAGGIIFVSSYFILRKPRTRGAG